MNQFYKGRTNNHLTWVMVDATDFATPESAASAATTIKIYGKLRGGTGTNFVASGAGSMTNDITHVGASATGIYTIALAKADLSDASAAWYDQYIITLSCTGCARQTLIVDGGIDASTVLAFSDMLSDIFEVASDAHSAAILGASNASEAQSHATLAASRVLLVQSRLSDFTSAVYPSDISNIVARLVDLSAVVSDIGSDIIVMSDVLSDTQSKVAGLGAGQSASAIADKVWSDYGSKVGASASDVYSNLLSVVAGANPTASDIASVVWTNAPGAAAASRILRIISDTSQIDSVLSSLNSEFLSRVPKAVANNSQLSDLASDLRSYLVGLSATVSDIYSLASNINSATVAAPDASDFASAVLAELSDSFSDIKSAVLATNPTASDIASVVWTNTPGAAAASRILRILSDTSQINSELSDMHSDLTVMSGVQSDIYSMLSDLHSDVGALTAEVSDLHSDVLVMSDVVSNIYSNLTRGVNVTQLNGTSLNGDGGATPWGP